MKTKQLFLALFLSLVSFSCWALDVVALLKETDRARGGIEGGVSWDVKIKSMEDGQSNERVFSVKAKGDNAHVKATAPAKNKGEIFLFNDRSMWFFKPSLKKPVSISSRERLTGQAANGDIASTHYARDYTPTLERTEKSKGEKIYVVLLKAKSDQVTYDQIRYWISEKKKLGIQAEFLTLQGVPFKRAKFEYNNSIKLKGKKTPFISKMVIIDAKFKSNYSSMTYTTPKSETHSDSLFNINNLAR